MTDEAENEIARLRGDAEIARLRLEAAHAEIARLRLTDAEREAVERASHRLDYSDSMNDDTFTAATLRGLLERMK